jgi:RNA polymerase sigma-70 factor, ECF subfamily
VKVSRGWLHIGGVQLAIEDQFDADADAGRGNLDLTLLYQQHADFVWRSLQHLGVRESDLEDLMQEVFVTVHRRLATFRRDSKFTTWLFGICLRLVLRHRRRAYFRWERPMAEPPEQADAQTPEDRYRAQQANAQLELLLWRLSPERRATFMLFEIEGASCTEIAELSGVPVGTVYSRLHAARKHVSVRLATLQRAGKIGALP